jgi:hypothetical protein
VGEAGPVEQSSAEAKSLKLRAKDYPVATPVGNNWGSQTGGPEGKIKNYSHDNLLKETELKAALTGSTRREKGSPPKKAQRLKKKRHLLYAPNLKLQKGKMSKLMKV